MADNTVDSILIDIQAPAEEAKGGLDKIKKSLAALKSATEGLDTEKLRQIAESMTQISTTGEGAKSASEGIKAIAKSFKSLNGIDTDRLKKVADVIQMMSAGLGNLGNNNKISIKIDSEGVKKAVQPLNTVKEAIKETASAESNVTPENSLDQSINKTGQDAVSASEKIQELITQINNYKATISQMEHGKKDFNSEEYEQAVQGLSRVQTQFNEYKESMKETPKTIDDIARSFQSVGQAAQQSGLGGFGKALSTIASLLPMIEVGGMEASAGLQQMAVALEGVQAAIPVIGLVLTLITALVNACRGVANSIKTAVNNAVAAVKSGLSKIRDAIKAAGTWLGNLFDDVKKNIGLQNKSFGEMTKKFKAFMRLFTFMALRKALTALFSNIGNSFNLLTQYSDRMGTKFNENVSMIVSDAKWLSNSIIAAFAPILNAVAPIIDALIAKLVAAINVINMFFAALSGGRTWTKAKKNVENYGAGLDSAAGSAKKAKKAIDDLTTGIDELNILRQDNNDDSGGGGGGGGINPEDYFEEEALPDWMVNLSDWIKDLWEDADFTELGKVLGDKLAAALASIPWDKIKQNARKLGKSLATFINGFIKGQFDGKSVSWWIGHTIAEAINTAFEFVNSFVKHLDWDELGKAFTDLIKGALETLDWKVIYETLTGIGRGIAKFLNSVFADYTMWQELGKTISNAINGVFAGAYNFVATFNFGNFGKAIATGLGDALTGISWEGIGYMLSTGLNGVFETLYEFSETFPWEEFASNFANGINTALENLNWGTIKSGFDAFCAGVGTNLNTAITEINWAKLGGTLGSAINTLISGIGKFIGNIDFKQVGSDIAAFINEAIQTIDFTEAGETVNSLVNGVCDLIDKVLEEVDWNAVLADVGEFMSKVDWDRIYATTFKVMAKAWTFENMFKGVSFGTIGISIVGGIGDGIDEAFANIGAWLDEHIFTPISDGIKGLFGSEAGDSEVAKGWGGDIVAGFLNGLTFSDPIVGALRLFIDFVRLIKELFGINSPSTLFEGFGKDIIAGFKLGLETFTELYDTVVAWAADVVEWFTKGEDGKGIVEHFIDLGGDVVKGFEDGVKGITETWGNIKTGFTETWDNVKENTSNAWNNVKETMTEKFNKGKETVLTVAGNVKEKVESTWDTVKEKTSTTWQNVKDAVSEKISSAKETASTKASELKEKVGSAWDNLKTKTSTAYENIKTDATGKFSNMKTTVENAGQNLKTAVSQRWDELKKKTADSYQSIKQDTTAKFSNMKTTLETAGQNLKTAISQRWDELKKKTSDSYQSIKKDATDKFENLKSSLSTTSDNIKSTISNAWDSVKSTASTKWDEIKGTVQTLYEGLKTTLEGISFESVGSNIINGIWKGVEGGWDWLTRQVSNVADSLLDAAKDALGIESPSKEFAEIGEYIVKGMGKGLESYTTIKKIVTSFADSVVSWFKGTGSSDILTRFTKIATDTVEGFKKQIETTYTDTKAPTTTWAENVRKWFNDGSFGGVNTATWLKYAQDVITSFADKITTGHGETQSPTTTWANNLRTWFSNGSFGAINNTTWTNYANEVINGFKDKIVTGHGATQSPVITWASNLKTWFNNSSFGSINNAKWTSFALEVITGFKDKITNGHGATQSPITTWASNLKNWFSSTGHGAVNASTWQTFATNVIDGFKGQITSGHGATQGPMQTFATNVIAWFENPDGETLVSHFFKIGANIIQGFIDGISSLWDIAMRKIREFGEAIIGEGEDATEEASPSKAFKRIGRYVVEGFNIGLESEMSSTFEKMHEWLGGINASMAVTPKIAVDTSALQNYSVNYGTDFADASITHKVRQELGISSAIQADVDSGKFSDDMRKIIVEELAPYLARIDTSTQIQAEKKETVNVEIGRRTVRDAVIEQRSADGFNFTPSFS